MGWENERRRRAAWRCRTPLPAAAQPPHPQSPLPPPPRCAGAGVRQGERHLLRCRRHRVDQPAGGAVQGLTPRMVYGGGGGGISGGDVGDGGGNAMFASPAAVDARWSRSGPESGPILHPSSGPPAPALQLQCCVGLAAQRCDCRAAARSCQPSGDHETVQSLEFLGFVGAQLGAAGFNLQVRRERGQRPREPLRHGERASRPPSGGWPKRGQQDSTTWARQTASAGPMRPWPQGSPGCLDSRHRRRLAPRLARGEAAASRRRSRAAARGNQH